ncbi:MAG: SDR family NAD(P)-dependent oxidoreductase, partial [Myxococcota bacterium]
MKNKTKLFERFAEKVAVITGAGNGIGRALAQQLHRCGARLALVDVDQNALDQTLSTLSSSSDVTTYRLDVSDRQAYQ